MSCGSRCAAVPSPKTSLPEGRRSASAADETSAPATTAIVYAVRKTSTSQHAHAPTLGRTSRSTSPAARNRHVEHRAEDPVGGEGGPAEAVEHAPRERDRRDPVHRERERPEAQPGRRRRPSRRASDAANANATIAAASGKSHMGRLGYEPVPAAGSLGQTPRPALLVGGLLRRPSRRTFRRAAEAGYGGVEVMVTKDPASQDGAGCAASPTSTACGSARCTPRRSC